MHIYRTEDSLSLQDHHILKTYAVLGLFLFGSVSSSHAIESVWDEIEKLTSKEGILMPHGIRITKGKLIVGKSNPCLAGTVDIHTSSSRDSISLGQNQINYELYDLRKLTPDDFRLEKKQTKPF